MYNGVLKCKHTLHTCMYINEHTVHVRRVLRSHVMSMHLFFTCVQCVANTRDYNSSDILYPSNRKLRCRSIYNSTPWRLLVYWAIFAILHCTKEFAGPQKYLWTSGPDFFSFSMFSTRFVFGSILRALILTNLYMYCTLHVLRWQFEWTCCK